MKPTNLAPVFAAMGLPAPVPEFRFHKTRRWRFDWCWPEYSLAMEIQGGGFIGGRHSRGMGMEKDAEKFSHAAILGWRVLMVTPKMVKDGRAFEYARQALEARA